MPPRSRPGRLGSLLRGATAIAGLRRVGQTEVEEEPSVRIVTIEPAELLLFDLA